MQNYSKVAGVLTIVGGAVGVIWLLFGVFSTVSLPAIFNSIPAEDLSGLSPDEFNSLVTAFYLAWGVIAGVCGAVAIVGGVYALKGRLWGLALAGAILTVFTFFPLGVVATVFTAMAKPEFQSQPAAPATGGTVG